LIYIKPQADDATALRRDRQNYVACVTRHIQGRLPHGSGVSRQS
jgi:hypothetical protein